MSWLWHFNLASLDNSLLLLLENLAKLNAAESIDIAFRLGRR